SPLSIQAPPRPLRNTSTNLPPAGYGSLWRHTFGSEIMPPSAATHAKRRLMAGAPDPSSTWLAWNIV
ncbi:MAG: hypothetical protein PVJ32_09105, partial [Anaerolineales bacterium]